MKKYKTVKLQEVSELICDSCGLKAHVNEGYEFSEFITIEHKCGYGAIHGDGKQFSIDLCQQCFADMCGDTLSITDPLDNQEPEYSSEDTLEYNNIFQAITQSKTESNKFKKDSDIRTVSRDILSADKIRNQEELQVSLKRVEQLWDAQYHSAEGNELHKLANLICTYENKNWDSYFAQEPFSDDDFMPERLNFEAKPSFHKVGDTEGKLSNILVNKDNDDDKSCQSLVDEENTD